MVAREGTSPLTTFFGFTVTLSQRRHQTVTVHFATADGTATAGSDYVKRSGTLTFSPGATVLPVEIGVVADAVFEHNETFVVNLSGASLGVRIRDGQGQGVIQNDDPDRIGLAELTPFASVTRVGDPLPVTLSWTHPVRWRDLDTVDLRLRGASGIVIWLRFDEAANTFAVVDPTNATPGPGFPPGQPGQLAGGPVTVLLDASRVRADGPDAPLVDLTFALSFAPEALGRTYTVEAAATDDSGDAQDFDDVGTISVAAVLLCPGDCDGDGAVRVNELLTGVNIALDPTAFGLCPSFDADGDVSVEIGELVAAVNAALTGCP